MTRTEDWPERLSTFIEKARDRAFSYGEWDCALMVAAWVRECTGEDYAVTGYASETEAAAIARDGGGLPALVTAALGEPIAPALAQRGDVVMVARPPDEWAGALGVCVGEHAACVGRSGLVFVPMSAWRKAWRVGRA